jgi:hypothetical protein
MWACCPDGNCWFNKECYRPENLQFSPAASGLAAVLNAAAETETFASRKNFAEGEGPINNELATELKCSADKKYQ